MKSSLRKICFLIFTNILIYANAQSEVITLEECPFFDYDSMYLGDIQKNTLLQIDENTTLSQVARFRKKINDYALYVINENINGYIPIRYVYPESSKELLMDSLRAESNTEYLLDLYFDGLIKMDKEIIRNKLTNNILYLENGYGDEFNFNWVFHCYEGETNLVVSNISIDIIGYKQQNWIITNVKFENNMFVLDANCVYWGDYDSQIPEAMWPTLANNYSLLLEQDGDYLKLYLKTKDFLLASFSRTDKETLKQFENFLNDRNFDISKIRWPRRADGTSDYDDKRIINPHPGMRYHTAVQLRLRSSQDVTSDILTTLEKDTKMTVIDTGNAETIDGVTSNWVRVKLEDGSNGWCFGGFLHGPIVEAVPAPVLPVVQYTDTQQETEIEKETGQVEEEPKVVPDYTIPFLGGVSLLILGIVVIVVARKRKRYP